MVPESVELEFVREVHRGFRCRLEDCMEIMSQELKSVQEKRMVLRSGQEEHMGLRLGQMEYMELRSGEQERKELESQQRVGQVEVHTTPTAVLRVLHAPPLRR